jgi:hypothetical protein
MPKVQTGLANNPANGSDLWDIVVSSGGLCKFNHAVFHDIVHGTSVKFIDDDAFPGMAEMVYSQDEINDLARLAIPTGTAATPAALEILEAYIMRKLLSDRLRVALGLSSLKPNLEERLDQIKDAVLAAPSKRLTVTILTSLGIDP